ncbi:DNA-binding protein [Pseudomonas sp. NFX71]|uniref:DNA-binding protein n=1 Tax=Pseudomonas sp. NFX71 TaxID=3399121 RepID=UPI003A8A5F3B
MFVLRAVAHKRKPFGCQKSFEKEPIGSIMHSHRSTTNGNLIGTLWGATSTGVFPMALRTADQAKAVLKAKGISITQWAIANQFSPNLVFEVLGGRKKCVRGQAHEIAVKLGIKAGEICTDPAKALESIRFVA